MNPSEPSGQRRYRPYSRDVVEDRGEPPEEKQPGVRTHFEVGNASGPYTVICRECGEVGHFNDPVTADEAAQAHRRKHLEGG
jgi:hypothetical protein